MHTFTLFTSCLEKACKFCRAKISNQHNNREVKLHVYFSRERQKGNFYRLPFIAQYVKVSSFVFGVSQ